MSHTSTERPALPWREAFVLSNPAPKTDPRVETIGYDTNGDAWHTLGDVARRLTDRQAAMALVTFNGTRVAS